MTNRTSILLRQLFRDTEGVKIYPDDFINEDTKEVETNILFPDLIDRRRGHFSDRRLVVLFLPGVYENINFPVGYWTQVLGLGESPDQVKFTGQLGVYALPANTDNPKVGSLDTFWRSAENFEIDTSFVRNDKGEWCVPTIVLPTSGTDDEDDAIIHSLVSDKNTGKFPSLYPLPDLSQSFPKEASNYDPSRGMLWAVSQAAPLRRAQVGGNLHLSLGDNFASGGFMSNVNVDKGGYLMMGSQQQFCVRNCDVSEKAFGGAWSMVFNGCRTELSRKKEETASQSINNETIAWVGKAPLVSYEPSTGVRVEKPYICIGKDGDGDVNDDEKVYLVIPQLQMDSQGIDHLPPPNRVEIDNLKKVRIVTPSDPFSQVKEAVDMGAHLVLSPGIYNWGETLEIRHSNQVLLGLGLATIQAPGTGRPCIHVSSQAQGVRLAGLSLEASVISKFIYEGSTLLEWGDVNSLGNKSRVEPPYNNPGAIHDLYCFVGGRSSDRTVQVQTMVKIYSNHVIGDNLWLWRADHVKRMNEKELPNRPELSEYHVTTFGECRCDTGLEVFGDHVSIYGLAIEHTYRDMLIWHGHHGSVYFFQSEMPYDVPGDAYRDVTGYRVYPTAHHHTGKGIGVYSYFRDHDDVQVDSAVVHHGALNCQYENVFAVWLNGYSGIRSILNGEGGDTAMPGRPFSIASYQGSGNLSIHFWRGIQKKLMG